MTGLFSMSKSQLETMHKDQKQAIEKHKERMTYSSDQRKQANVLKRLERRLGDIETALDRF